MTPIDWIAVAKEIHDINVEKGWWAEPRSPARCYNLMLTEPGEAYQAWRKELDDAKVWDLVAEELVDTVIRILDFMQHNDLLPPHEADRIERWTRVDDWRPADIHAYFDNVTLKVTKQITHAHTLRCEGSRHGEQSALATAVIEIVKWSQVMGRDFGADLRKKIDHNKTRPHRHGGRRA